MSERAMWKMLQLLNRDPSGRITRRELADAGVDCHMDTIQLLIDSGAVETKSPNRFPGKPNDHFWISKPARHLLNSCVVANKWLTGTEMHVDSPRVFVIMPFSRPWSKDVEKKLIQPAVEEAGLYYDRGDKPLRVADLATNIWNSILLAGIIIAEVSEPNPNVFYELGLVHAMGKPAFLLVQSGKKPPINSGSKYNLRAGQQLPADFGGAHYYEYDRRKLDREKAKLSTILKQWASEYGAEGVRALLTKKRGS